MHLLSASLKADAQLLQIVIMWRLVGLKADAHSLQIVTEHGGLCVLCAAERCPADARRRS
jgi:hypothetical protein